MAYVDVGQNDPIVCLHGSPTTSLIWRDVISQLKPYGDCIDPDLIGMGDSNKLPNRGPESYGLLEHQGYLDKLLEKLAW